MVAHHFDEGVPWLVVSTTDGDLTLVGRLDMGGDTATRPVVAVVPAP